jgi:[glutamine synthetase] adenylyltransferase / [glutamine synthetase]-adenylyl-L-tyrosine phosphorylase
VAGSINAILTVEREPAAVRRDALAMRALIAQEKGDQDGWDLKLARGGLLDIEFVAQTVVLIHGRLHPSLVRTATHDILDAAIEAQALPAETGTLLRDGYAFMRDLFQWQRLSVAGDFAPSQAAAGLKRRMAAVVGLPDFRVLERELADLRARVAQACAELLS